jgi:hypothetical protein
MIRKWAEFKADFPDDGIEDENGFVQFSGKGVTEEIGRILTGAGCTVSAPEDEREHGWTLDIKLERQTFWCQVSDLDECFYLVLQPQGFFQGDTTTNYVRLLKHLDTELQRDPRFTDIIWRTQDEMPSGTGADHPVS